MKTTEESASVQSTPEATIERRAAENAAWVAAIIEYSSESIVSITLEGIVIGWNCGAEKLYRYTAEEMIGRSMSILFPHDHYQEYLQIMQKVRHGETVASFDTVRQRKDGTIINVSVGLTPVETREGEVVGASKNSHDITRIKMLEAQFIEAQKMEVIGQLAAGVAHDFNNMLTVIMGYSDLIKSGLATESPLQKYNDQIRHASERALGVTRQLLVFSRKQTVQPTVLDLNNVVTEMDQMLRRLIDDNIEMTIVPGKEIGRVSADSGYVGQVLMNLVVNARDALPDGGKLNIATSNVTLDENYTRTHAGVIPGDYVMLSVSDTGTGITDEVKKRLFEPLFTTKPSGKGTGLGLITCQTIVQQSGGHIGVYSEVGKGTTFKVYFPIIAHTGDALAKPFQTGSLPRGTETLLIVEDDPSLRYLARTILENLGYEILSASNGRDALHIAQNRKGAPIRLVITDVVMPLMSGNVMAERLKTTYPNLKILYTSGYTHDVILHHGMLEAGIEFLPKPYTPAMLAGKMRQMLDH
jgi:PAS domain S-box-containing protein